MKKTVAQIAAETEHTELKRSLGPINLVLLGIGCIIGTGIFVLTGHAAAEHAGPAIMISFVITGTLCAFVALCYAELASVLPVSGSAYSYSYASLGEFAAWVMGVLLLLEYGLAASTVAVGWSGYVMSFLGVNLGLHLPAALTAAPGIVVATHQIATTVTDPVVDIAGSLATLSDGAQAMIQGAQGAAATAVLGGPQEIHFDIYKAVGEVRFALGAGSVVSLDAPAQALDLATGMLRELPAGTALAFADGTGARGVLSADTVRALPDVAAATTTAVVNLPAIIGIAAVTLLLVIGVSESATVNNIVVAIKVSVVLAFIVIGAFYVKPELWQPLVPPQEPPPVGGHQSFLQELGQAFIAIFTGDNSHRYGVGGVIHGAAVIFFAYLGFEAVSTAGAESKNPARDMPIGILGSLIVCTILYILTSAVLVGIVPYSSLDGPAPIADAVDRIGLGWFAVLVKIGAIAGLSSVMLVLCYGQTRIFYTMSRDGLLPSALAAVHKKFKTPWINTLIVGGVAAAAAGFLSLDVLNESTSVGTLAAFTIVCITVIYLRFTQPKLPRPFRAPLGLVTPVLGAVLSFILLLQLLVNPVTRHFFTLYALVGLAAYFAYGVWNSKLAKGQVVTGHEAAPMETPHTP